MNIHEKEQILIAKHTDALKYYAKKLKDIEDGIFPAYLHSLYSTGFKEHLSAIANIINNIASGTGNQSSIALSISLKHKTKHEYNKMHRQTQ